MESYFINPLIEALDSASPEERSAMIRKIAACVGDEAALRNILGIDPEDFNRFYPDMAPKDLSTEATIDSFISLYAEKQTAKTTTANTKQNDAADAIPLPEVPIAAPAIDYAMMLEAEDDAYSSEEMPDDGTSDMISAFLHAVPAKKPKGRTKINTPAPQAENKAETQTKMPEPATHNEDPTLSEELFKLMVKNKNYTKALEIITELSLNNPKKSVYFAYQMRFLKKLIKNQANGAI